MHESYLTVFFEQMNIKFLNEWCILHSFENLPKFSESDVDMAFSGTDVSGLEALIVDVANKTGWSLFQKLWYDVETCYYYVLKKNDSDVLLALDFLMDNNGIGRYGFNTKMLTRDNVLYNELFPIPNPEVAFCYKLIKRIEKKRSLDEDKEYLMSQYSISNSNRINIFLKQQFGQSGKELIDDYLSDKINLDKESLALLVKKRKQHTSNILSSIRYFYWETKRTINRIFYPCGIHITIPVLNDFEQKIFVEALGEKVDILFRFVKLNKENSLKTNFISMSGSTLVINSKLNFNGKKAIKYQWFKSLSIKPSELNIKEKNIEMLVDTYYDFILQSLSLRMHRKIVTAR